MNILICVAVFDTDQNKRTAYTIETYKSLMQTVNFDTTEIVFIDNASCAKTKKFLKSVVSDKVHVITNETNVGTAEAINIGINRYAGENTFCVKLDNDVTFGRYGWGDEMREVIESDDSIGILGLKRKDLPNQPTSKEYPTTLEFINHDLGDKWRVVEICEDIIGTCTMFNPSLLNEIGYLWQPSEYAFDDVLVCARSLVAGFRNAFYPCVDIEHLDDGKNPYTEWKRKHAGLHIGKITGIINEYQSGERDIYYNPFEK